jgi:predicted transcriptional regulator YdeE
VSEERKPLEWEVVERHPMNVIGHSIRTNNADEADPETAKIPGLWDLVRSQSLEELIPGAIDPETLVAVLSAYESDYRGDYSELVGHQARTLAELPEGMAGLAVASGSYAEIAVEGPLPYALIATWQQVWEAEDAGRLERAYEFDYELHRDGVATLYLSVVPG